MFEEKSGRKIRYQSFALDVCFVVPFSPYREQGRCRVGVLCLSVIERK